MARAEQAIREGKAVSLSWEEFSLNKVTHFCYDNIGAWEWNELAHLELGHKFCIPNTYDTERSFVLLRYRRMRNGTADSN